MKSPAHFILCFSLLLCLAPTAFCDKKADDLQRKKDQKAEKAKLKQEKIAAKFAADHPEPVALSPAHPLSVRTEYFNAIRQAVAQIDNAWKVAEEGSDIEFAYTIAPTNQLTAAVGAASSNIGEVQVAQALIAYGEIPGICRDSMRVGGSVLMAVLGGGIARCNEIGAFRRRVLELTLLQNYQ